MILVDKEIRECIVQGSLEVTPYDDSLINPASLDFRLGGRFGILSPTGSDGIIDPTVKDSFITEYFDADEYILQPGAFLIATSLEEFNFKGDAGGSFWKSYGLAAKVMGKSSLGRLALINSSHAGWIDPGFSSLITLELNNLGSYPIRLSKGMKIGQLVLFKTVYPENDYSKTGRYSGQAAAQGSLGL